MKIPRILPVRHSLARAFTLIELLVVIAIIALLAALSMGTFNMATQASSRNRTAATLQAIMSALERYKEANGEYPVTPSGYSSGKGSETTHGFSTTDSTSLLGAQMLYQAITGDGDNQLVVNGSGGSNSSLGSVQATNAQNIINGDFVPTKVTSGSSTTWKSKLNSTMVDTTNRFYLMDGFGHPFQYERAATNNVTTTQQPAPITVNPTYDLWSYSTATNSGDPVGTYSDRSSSGNASKIAIWIKNW
jgi:prepilin-type N-terminal cleavage/methylation domain-containing protein